MKKAYCKNCKFAHRDLVCYWDALRLLKEEITGKEIKAYLNEGYNCLYYRRKWWKVWVR
ncbi:hypothetical protein LCGC14_2058360 [marine sediment metagenome]|uniref:Uncharacterized protein n=1 Tax=marine sediment metagenome TaxID=412755 RepID=A0A0F9HIW6_9ZZZZ